MNIGADRKERLACLTAVTLLHLVLAPALVMSLAPTLGRNVRETLGVFNVREVPPPPPVPEVKPPPPPPEKKRVEAPPKPAPQREPPPPAAPPPVAASKRILDKVSPPVAAGLVPGSGGNVGALEGEPNGRLLGSGSGTGGGGSGGSGTGGIGGNGIAKAVRRAELRSGKIGPADYPRGAKGQQGVVETALAVDAGGNVSGCEITRSSGNRVLDDTTCRLIRQRFKFTPARDAQGNAVPSERGWQQRWWRD